jgi:hypothetical protein
MLIYRNIFYDRFEPPTYLTILSKYSDTSANDDNSFRNHIR